jgi:hypothetical protein
LQAKAVEAYRAELEKKAAGQEYKSSRTICQEFMDMHFQDTRKRIKLNHATITDHAAGKPTRAQSNAEESWLTPGESKVVIDYIVECIKLGCRLDLRTIALQARNTEYNPLIRYGPTLISLLILLFISTFLWPFCALEN